MTEVPAVRFRTRGGKRLPAPGGTRPSPPPAWNTESVQPVEIVAPDRQSMALLLEEAVALFPAELVGTDSSWVVRLQPPAGEAWVLDLLELVERWLESARLPCANVLYGGRSYLIRASIEIAEFRAAAESIRALSPGVWS